MDVKYFDDELSARHFQARWVRVFKVWTFPLVIEKHSRKLALSVQGANLESSLNKQVMPVLSLPVMFMIFGFWKTTPQGQTHLINVVHVGTNQQVIHLAGSSVTLRAKLPGPWQTTAWQALPRHLRHLTASAALFSNLALKYAALFNSQLLSARLAVSVQKCRVCLTFLKRFCNRGKRLSWPQCVISGTLPAWYSVLHSAGFITLEADTLVAR